MFDHCTTMQELKQEYHRLAFANHPDHGGDTEKMKAVNAAYTAATQRFSRYRQMPKADRRAAADERQANAAVKRAIDAIEQYSGLKIELVGLWIWVSGATYPYRQELKDAGYRWASKKGMWYFKGCASSGRGVPMDQIRETYGSVIIKSNGPALLTA